MGKNHNNGISPVQEKAAHLLATGMKVQDVAESISVNRTTIWIWKKDPDFIVLMNNLRNEYRDSCRSAIWSLHSDAEETLKKSFSANSESVALRAALAILARVEVLTEAETDAELIKAEKAEKEFSSKLKAGII